MLLRSSRTARRAVLRLTVAFCLLGGLTAAGASAQVPTPLASWGGISAANPLAGVSFWREGPRWGLAAGQIARWLGYDNPRAASVFGDAVSWDAFSQIIAREAPLLSPDTQQKVNLMLKVASQPETKRFGAFTGSGATTQDSVSRLLQRAEQTSPGQVPVLGVYRLKHIRCGGYGDSPADAASYRGWLSHFARGVGRHPAVIFLEQDALITTPCLSGRGIATRMAELRYATSLLGGLPHAVTYLDAGAADAVSARRTVKLLKAAGVANVRGFFLNSTHFDWTRRELGFGDRISRALGGTHFVVNTTANGNGPLVPSSRVRYGNEVLCNPTGRALGPRPSTFTGDPRADAFMWIGDVGRSGGQCHPGDKPTGTFDPDLALGLAARANEQMSAAEARLPY